MNNLKKEYDDLTKQRKEVISELTELEKNDIVKKYLQLKNQNEDLYNNQLVAYKKMKEEEYDSCNHILVYSKITSDRYEGRTYRSCGCIKCGLDNSILSEDRRFLCFGDQVMYDYLRERHLHYSQMKGNLIEVVCDLDLASAIYSKIKETYPDISDELAIKYFEIALNNIRRKKVSSAGKINRAKRLSLSKKFDRWNASDVWSK